MIIRYDSKIDALYIELAKGKYYSTRKIIDAILVNEDRKVKVLGIEILDATENINALNPSKTKVSIQTS